MKKSEPVRVWIGEDMSVCAAVISIEYDENWVSESTIERAQNRFGEIMGSLIAESLNKIHKDN